MPLPRSTNDLPISLAAALDAARRDGETQAQHEEHLRAAASFVFELVEYARAYGEELPRGYMVAKVKGRQKGKKGVVPRVELRRVGRGFFGPAPHKVAMQNGDGTQLLHTRDFAKHLKSGWLDELGEWLVTRFRKNQRETQKLGASVEAITTIRRHLADVERSSD